jgi:TrmH family RNA methyltransferase
LITSTKNARVRSLLELQKSRERRKRNEFLIEGIREISLAIQGQFKIEEIFVCEDIYKPNKDYPIDLGSINCTSINNTVFNKLAYRENVGGLIALTRAKHISINQIPSGKTPFLLVAENLEKPGNIGALLRTANSAGVDALIITDPLTDIYNPNIIRSSLGCVFTVPVIVTSNEDCLGYLKSKSICTFAAAIVDSSIEYYKADFTTPCAIIVGSEAYGLQNFWLENGDYQIIIPMKGAIDSINVSNAAAILMFEVLRQRAVKLL